MKIFWKKISAHLNSGFGLKLQHGIDVILNSSEYTNVTVNRFIRRVTAGETNSDCALADCTCTRAGSVLVKQIRRGKSIIALAARAQTAGCFAAIAAIANSYTTWQCG